MRSLFLDQETWLHRVPAAVKLAGLSAAGAALFAFDSLPVAAGAAAAACLLVGSLGRLSRKALPGFRGLAVALVLLAAGHAWLDNWQAGMAAALRLLALVLLGVMLTLTTRFDHMLEAAERASAPLRNLGFRPERIALGFGLMLRFVEAFFLQWQRLDEAHRARSGRPGGWRLLAPLALHVMAAAGKVGDALTARLGE